MKILLIFVAFIPYYFCLASSTQNLPPKSAGTRVSLAKETKKSLQAILKENEKLHLAFYKYDKMKVEEVSQKVSKKIDLIQNKKILKSLKRTQKNLASIKSSNDKNTNIDKYARVSLGLIKVLKKYDLGAIYNVFTCPMVKKKWIQNTKARPKVRNPYDHRMPSCGSQETNFK